jgi:perosamine synthetase
MTGLEHEALKAVIDANYLNEGDVTERFETELARRLGVTQVVTATSGTAAIFLSLAALGVGHGDEVVVPDLTFIATANAVTLAGATPVLADVDPRTLNLDPQAFERAITARTKAVVPVHVSGRGADMKAIIEIASQHGIAVVEDAAEAFMSRQGANYLGTLGITGCFSFSPNKTITTGQGGAIATNDAALASRLRELKDQGRPTRGTGGDDLHPAVGFNFKFTNMQAAIGLAQLTKLEERLARQKAIYRAYESALGALDGVRLPGFDINGGEIPQWTDAVIERRAEFDRYLAEHGAGCRRFWFPLHTQAPYRKPDAQFPVAMDVGRRAIWLPSAFTMTETETERVCDLIRAFAKDTKAVSLTR